MGAGAPPVLGGHSPQVTLCQLCAGPPGGAACSASLGSREGPTGPSWGAPWRRHQEVPSWPRVDPKWTLSKPPLPPFGGLPGPGWTQDRGLASLGSTAQEHRPLWGLGPQGFHAEPAFLSVKWVLQGLPCSRAVGSTARSQAGASPSLSPPAQASCAPPVPPGHIPTPTLCPLSLHLPPHPVWVFRERLPWRRQQEGSCRLVVSGTCPCGVSASQASESTALGPGAEAAPRAAGEPSLPGCSDPGTRPALADLPQLQPPGSATSPHPQGPSARS